jgi:PIN domain nuclease of toxin-antitoxin system
MSTVLLDTHIALWLDTGDDRLRPSTRDLIDDCWRSGGTVLLSAVSAWEIAQLVSVGRIRLDCAADEWVERFLDRDGMEAVPLSHRAASRVYRFDRFEHRDPADRLLIATSIEVQCPLVTYDIRITQFGRRYGKRHGFAVAT